MTKNLKMRMLTLVALFIFLNYNWAVMTEGFILSRSSFLNHYKTNDVKAPSIDSITLNQAVEKAHEKLTQRQLENSVSGSHLMVKNSPNYSCPSAMKNYYKRMLRTGQVSEIDKKASLLEETTKVLVKELNLKDNDMPALAAVDLEKSKLQDIISDIKTKQSIICNPSQKYRNIDGTCNNDMYPEVGSSFTCLHRILQPNYADGVSEPRKAISGEELPSPRLVSSTIHTDKDNPAHFTHFVMQWGQIIDHDLTFAPFSSFPEEELILGDGGVLVDCCDPNQQNPLCFPISIPSNDPFYSQYDQTCLSFRRSAKCLTTTLGTREQINALTGFLDGSMVYGSQQNTSEALRTFQNGLLKSFTDPNGKMLLPQSPKPSEDLCSDTSQNLYCFFAGDDRLNEQPGLTAIHTVLLRQHNMIAKSLMVLNPCWDDEKLYQESRRFVIAQIQMITYNEFLRVVLGDYYDWNLKPLYFGFTNYDPYINPSILNEFSASAFRFGHTLVQNLFNEINSAGTTTSFQLRESFFKPFAMYDGQLDRVLRGLAAQPAQEFDNFIVEDVTNHLFQKPGEDFGLDLASFNIQRGRDHGIRGYVDYVQEFFNLPIATFSDLDILMPSTVWTAFENIYKSVKDIDHFSGGVAENPVTNGVVGPIFAIIIRYQFLKLKYGDKYYFEHWNQPGSFTHDQLKEIRKTTLSKILCDNSDGIQELQFNVFLPASFNNPVYLCAERLEISVNPWFDRSCSK